MLRPRVCRQLRPTPGPLLGDRYQETAEGNKGRLGGLGLPHGRTRETATPHCQRCSCGQGCTRAQCRASIPCAPCPRVFPRNFRWARGSTSLSWAKGSTCASSRQPFYARAVRREEPPIGFRNQEQRVRRVTGIRHIRQAHILAKQCWARSKCRTTRAHTDVSSHAHCVHTHTQTRTPSTKHLCKT
jgi:hypothetical protein